MKGFVNPYNFIKFPEQKAKAYTDEDIHTGVIEYTITTKTPLFIPNSSSDSAFTESDKVKDHKSYDFFSYTELDTKKRYENQYHVPVIPGSEIRGVVRNVYETLTDSCMGLLNAEEYPVKRSSELFKPALLYKDKKGNLSLYEAKSLRIGEKAAYKEAVPPGFGEQRNGTVIYYKEPPKNDKHQPMPIGEYSSKPGKYQRKGYLIKWGMGVKKCRYHVFTVKTDPNRQEVRIMGIKVSKDIVERKLFPVIDSYLSQPAVSNSNKAAYEEYKTDLEHFLTKNTEGYFPVTYSLLEKGIFYLAPAIFTKEVSDNPIGKLAGEFAPCKEDHCPACELFGYVGRNNEVCKGSSIRFTDMYVAQEMPEKDYYTENKLTIQALGEPKLGNIDFYLKRPDGATFWNYDYYIKNGKIIVAEGLLRGRKYYWHHRKAVMPKDVEVSNLNKTIRPVRSNISFSGKLYFERISKKQLAQLIWILNSGKEGLGLKLGGAKPLGFGSISCNVDSVKERCISIVNGKIAYDMRKLDVESITYESAGFSTSVKDEFYKIADFEGVPKDVEITYPKTTEQRGKTLNEGYKWFVNNHGTLSGKQMAKGRVDVKIKEVLPEIMESDFSMEYNESYQKNQSNNPRGRGNYGGKKQGQTRKNNSQKRKY